MQNSRLWLSCTLLAAAWLLFSGQKAQAWFREQERTTLEVRSVPDGAQVQFDDRPIGMTDGVFKVDAGRMQVRVKKNGYEDCLATVEVKDGQHLLQSFDLRPLRAQLKVKNLKEEDVLWLGPGKARKVTSHDQIKLQPGLYEVWAVRDGLESERVLTQLEAGSSKVISLPWVSARPAARQEESEVHTGSKPVPTSSGPVFSQPSSPVSRPAYSRPDLIPDSRPAAQPYRPAPRIPTARIPDRPEPVFTPIAEPFHRPAVSAPPPRVSEPAPVFTPLP